MVKKKNPGFIGTLEWDDAPRPPRTRPSLFPSREQVAALPPFQPPPQRHTMEQQPEPVLAAVAQEADSNANAAELNDVEMEDAYPAVEYAPVDMDTEPSLPPATPAAPHSSSFRTPTAPRPDDYKTPAHGPSYSPITPPAQLAIENSDAGQDVSSLELPAPVATVHAPESTSALRFTLFGTPAVPRPGGYETLPHELSRSPIVPPIQPPIENSDAGQDISSLELPASVAAVHPPVSASALRSTLSSAPVVPRLQGYEPPTHVPSFSPLTPSAQPSAENSDAGRNSSVDEPAVSAVRDEPVAPRATSEQYIIELDDDELSDREVWDAAPPSPAQELEPISATALTAQGASSFPFLTFPPEVMHRILDFLLVYDESIALVRKSPNRRIVEADGSHILTVGKGRITREPQESQDKKFKLKSNFARNINTASPTNLFLVCSGLRDLGIKTYYNKNTFAFSDEQNLIGFAASIGSRRIEVRKVELRSEWEVLFNHNDIHSKHLKMTGDGVLYTTQLRVFPDIERVNIDIGLRMPWQRTGKLPDHDKVSLNAQNTCYNFGKWMARDMTDRFRRYELDTPFIAKHLHVWFDTAWKEPWYESAEYKRRVAEDKRKLAAERAAKAASSGKDS